jgi:hypothetical protein
MTPTLADFETAARVRYNGPNRGPGRARAAGTVLDVDPHPDQPDALRVTVLWDDQDDPHPYTVTADTLHLWTRLPDPRVYATEGTAPSSATDALAAADAAAVVWDAWQRETHASRGTPDPVRYDVAELPLMAAEHALAVAHHALTHDDGELVPADETAAWLRARVAERARRLS